jgi:hypothetical protein
MEQIKRHYYGSQRQVNPTGISCRSARCSISRCRTTAGGSHEEARRFKREAARRVASVQFL